MREKSKLTNSNLSLYINKREDIRLRLSVLCVSVLTRNFPIEIFTGRRLYKALNISKMDSLICNERLPARPTFFRRRNVGEFRRHVDADNNETNAKIRASIVTLSVLRILSPPLPRHGFHATLVKCSRTLVRYFPHRGTESGRGATERPR